MASCVQTPLLEKELVDMFMGTLQGLYYDKMVGSISSGFADLVTIGERIETGPNVSVEQESPSTFYFILRKGLKSTAKTF